MIIDHNNPYYKGRWQNSGSNRFNGAFYYSKEIVKNIIPFVKTERSWVTVNLPQENLVPQFTQCCCDGAIFFIHNNLNPDRYEWLRKYKDLILVCGVPETCDKVRHLGTPIYLPLSVDTEEVLTHKREKTKGICFAGRRSKHLTGKFCANHDIITGYPRDIFLNKIAEYEKVYAVGRVAIEAKVLGCDILPYDERFPDPSIWKVMDNSEAVDLLQKMLDEIDR